MNRVREHLRAAAGPAGLGVLFAGLAAATWRTWPDVLVDFGRELYLPWQVAAGRILYVDLAHYFGPLSVYWHALLFRIWGPSYTVLVVSNLAVLLVLLGALHQLLVEAASRAAAVTAGAAVLAMFAFSEYLLTGNYNYASPYAHEASHGMALAVVLMLLLHRARLRPRPGLLLAAGGVLGLLALTKLELFVAGGAAAGLYFLLQPRPSSRAQAGGFLAGALIPPAGFFALFCRHMPAAQALRAALRAAGPFAPAGVAQSAYYSGRMGFDHTLGNLADMAGETLGVLAALGAMVLLARLAGRATGTRRLLAWAGLAAFPAAFWLASPYHIGASLPVLDLIAMSVLARRVWAARRRGEAAPGSATLLGWALFAILLVGKMVLYARLFHYGFYEAMPSVVLLVVATVGLLPERLGAGAGPFRAAAVAAWAVLAGHCLLLSGGLLAGKTLPVGEGGDRILAFHPPLDDRGLRVNQALAWISANTRPDATLVVLPEGVMLNYLSRRINPTRFYNFLPTEMEAYGEPVILAELNRTAPDYIVLVHKDTREYGRAYFGMDPRYGRDIMAWVRERYLPVALFGAEPFQWSGFGIRILARKDARGAIRTP